MANEQLNKVQDWIWHVAAKKAVYGIAKFVTSVVMSAVAQNLLNKYGVHVDPQVFMTAVSVSLMAALEVVHDWAKLKTGWAFL